MADIEELIERLLIDAEVLGYEVLPSVLKDVSNDCTEAATALSAQQREIAELREALEPKRTHSEIDAIKRRVRHDGEVLDYIEELEALTRYHKKQADGWRGIASAMGYEPNAHEDVKPTSPWILERIDKYRAATNPIQERS